MERRSRLVVLACVFAATAAVGSVPGCHDNGGTASCTQGTGDVESGGLQMCEEFSALNGVQVNDIEQDCVLSVSPDAGAQQAVFSMGPCSRDRALGGCMVDTGGQPVTIWYYEDGTSTRAQIQAFCANSGAVYVAP
jgi:hypothetical protein